MRRLPVPSTCAFAPHSLEETPLWAKKPHHFLLVVLVFTRRHKPPFSYHFKFLHPHHPFHRTQLRAWLTTPPVIVLHSQLKFKIRTELMFWWILPLLASQCVKSFVCMQCRGTSNKGMEQCLIYHGRVHLTVSFTRFLPIHLWLFFSKYLEFWFINFRDGEMA